MLAKIKAKLADWRAVLTDRLSEEKGNFWKLYSTRYYILVLASISTLIANPDLLLMGSLMLLQAGVGATITAIVLFLVGMAAFALVRMWRQPRIEEPADDGTDSS